MHIDKNMYDTLSKFKNLNLIEKGMNKNIENKKINES